MEKRTIDLVCFDYDADGSLCLTLPTTLFEAIKKSITDGTAVETEDKSGVSINIGQLGFAAKRLVLQSDEPPCDPTNPNGPC